MAIAEQTILEPEAPKPGIPLKKSTLAVFGVLIAVLAVVSSLIMSAGGSTPTSAPADPSELKQTGNNQSLNDEEAAAKASASIPRRATLTASLPSGTPTGPLPPEVRRDENVGAIFDKKVPRAPTGVAAAGGAAGAREPDVEQEAAVRLAKALVHDFDEPARDAPAGTNTRAASREQGGATVPTDAAAPTVPSSYVNAQMENLKNQLAGGQAGTRVDQAWYKEYAKDAGSETRKVLTGTARARGLVLHQGKIIPAVLGRQLNSDLPGRITAYVTSNVYESEGRLVIPKGSSLIGRYDSGVKVGQSRLMFAFERLILPSGFSFDLPAAPGTDLAGASGMTGDVNNHFLKMFGSSLLVAVLADNAKQPTSVTQVGSSGPTTGAGQVLSDVSKSILERNRTIQPTITIEQGTRINVEVVADMVFPEQLPSR